MGYLLEDAVVLMQGRTEPENSLAPFRRIEDSDVARYGLQNVSEALRLMPERVKAFISDVLKTVRKEKTNKNIEIKKER